jgi:ribose-phosphate pyrophosphokinase
LELEFILNLLKERKISVELFVTFFPYARQDCVFQPGEINIAETLIKNWTRVYKVKKIWVVDAHFKGRDWVKKYPIKNISAVDVLKQAVLKKYPDIFLISPDSGAKRRSGLPGFKKKRKNSYEVKLTRDKNLAKAINGKVVGVFDDMIETGGTMVKACQKCRELGAKKVIAIATHGVMQSGVDRITKTFDELFLTNTINCASANVDVSDLIIRLSQKP